jgi:hypothetical protein
MRLQGGWRKLHNEELHNLYSSASIIRVIKSRRMRWAGHVKRMHIGFSWKSQKERDHYEVVDVLWRITLRWVSEK